MPLDGPLHQDIDGLLKGLVIRGVPKLVGNQPRVNVVRMVSVEGGSGTTRSTTLDGTEATVPSSALVRHHSKFENP